MGLGDGVALDPSIRAVAKELGTSFTNVAMRWILQQGHVLDLDAQHPLQLRSELAMLEEQGVWLTTAQMERLSGLSAASGMPPLAQAEEKAAVSLHTSNRSSQVTSGVPPPAFCGFAVLLFLCAPGLFLVEWSRQTRRIERVARALMGAPNAQEDQDALSGELELSGREIWDPGPEANLAEES